MSKTTNKGIVPSREELFNPVLKAIHSLGGSASNAEIADRAIEDMKLTSDVTDVPHGKGRVSELEYRLYWARWYLKKISLIDNSKKGIWSLTSTGHNTASVEPETVVRRVYEINRAARQERSEKISQEETEEEPFDDSSEELASWRDEVLAILTTMHPDTFERLCQRLLRESGFIEVNVTGKTGDGGIDGNGIIRLGGLISFPVLFQCKRYSGSVSANTVRDFRGAMIGRADKGLVITTGTFTREARREATRDGAPPVDLIDGELLIDKLKELRLGVNVRTVEVVEVDSEWDGFLGS